MSVKKLFDLSGRTAIVTGGSRGLGLQIAEALGEMGAKLALTARKKDELEHAVGASGEARHRGAAPTPATSASATAFPASSTRC